MSFPVKNNVLYITVDMMREVDRLMMEEFGIPLLKMMESAGSNLARLVEYYLGGKLKNRPIAVLAGMGHNGGGGLVAARHLNRMGAEVQVISVGDLSSMKEITRVQAGNLETEGIKVNFVHHDAADIPFSLHSRGYEAVIDAIFGYGINRPPEGIASSLIRWANGSTAVVIALDIPSGLDGDLGTPFVPCIEADATLTLAMPKVGLAEESAHKYVGTLYLADIHVPDELWKKLNMEVGELFEESPIVKVKTLPTE